jgi:hypothetical protein
MYVAHVKTLIDENFANGAYLTRARQLQELIDAHVQADPNKFYSYNDFRNNITRTVGSGAQAIFGIGELMDARVTHLLSHQAFQGVPPQVSDIVHTPSKVHPNTTVWFSAHAAGADRVFLGVRQGKAAAFTKIEMFDDGLHQDGLAGDGIYGAALSAGAGDLQYYLYAENTACGSFSPARAEYEFYELPLCGGRFIALEPNFPNPFRYSTTLTYNLPHRSRVTLKIFDVAGRVVDVLVDEVKEAGTYRAGLAPGSYQYGGGRGLSPGVYLARLAIRPTDGRPGIVYAGTAKLVVIR